MMSSLMRIGIEPHLKGYFFAQNLGLNAYRLCTSLRIR